MPRCRERPQIAMCFLEVCFSVRWPIYIINSVDKTKFLYTTSPPTQHHSFFRNYPLYSLRSRGTRERILIWFRRREKSRFFVDCKLAAPLGFCRDFGPRFRVHLSSHACSLMWLLSLFLGVFFELVFNSDCI